MKQLKWIGLAAVAGLLTVGISSCQKSGLKDATDNITSAQDFASSETEFASAFDIADDINQSDGKIKKGASTILPSGAVFTWVDSSFTDGDGIEYTLDFGPLGSTAPKGLLCGDGKYRAGVLHITLSDRYLNIGAMVSIQTAGADNYYSGDGTNMYRVEGELKVKRTAAEELTVEVMNGKVTDPENKMASFSGAKVIKRIQGGGTPGILDDLYEVTGEGSGTNREGENYTWKITTPLLKKLEVGCAKTFVKGVIEIKNTTASTSLKVDFDPYNNGACDRIAKAIIGSKEYIFTVK